MNRVSSPKPEVRINQYVMLAFAAYLVLPVINQGLPAIVRIALFLIGMIAYFTTLALTDREGLIESVTVLLLVLLFFALSYYGSFQAATLPAYLYSNVLFWVPFLFIFNKNLTEDKAFRQRMMRFVSVLFLLTAVTTVFGLLRDPMASRYLATGKTELYDLRSYSLQNIGGYGFVYALVLCIPIAICAHRTGKLKGYQLVLVLALFYACIFKSQYSTAIALSLAGLFAFFLGKGHNVMRTLFIFVSGAIVLYGIWQLLPVIIDWLTSLGKSAGFIAYRLRDTLGVIGSGGIDGLDRVQRANMSVSIFFEHPLAGNLLAIPQQELGGHSSILDTLACMGLLSVPFATFFLISYFCRFISKQVDRLAKPYVLACFVLFLALATVNTVFSSFTIATVLFLLPLGIIPASSIKEQP